VEQYGQSVHFRLDNVVRSRINRCRCRHTGLRKSRQIEIL
jgi:hypothetical protein